MDPQQFGSDLAFVLQNIEADETNNTVKIKEGLSDELKNDIKRKIENLCNELNANFSENSAVRTSSSLENVKDLLDEFCTKIGLEPSSDRSQAQQLNTFFFKLKQIVNNELSYEFIHKETSAELKKYKDKYNQIQDYLNEYAETTVENEDQQKFLQGLADNYANDDGLYKDTHPNQYLLIKHVELVKEIKATTVPGSANSINDTDAAGLIPENVANTSEQKNTNQTIANYIDQLNESAEPDNQISPQKRALLDTLFTGVYDQIDTNQPNPDLVLLYDLKNNQDSVVNNMFSEGSDDSPKSAYSVVDKGNVDEEKFNHLNKVIDTYKDCLSEEEKKNIETLKNNIDIQKQKIDNEETERLKQRQAKITSGGYGSGSNNSYVQSPGLNWAQLKHNIETRFREVVDSITVNYNQSEEEKDPKQTQINRSNLDDLNQFKNNDNVTSVNLQYKGGGQATYYPAKTTGGPNNNQPTFKINHDDSTPEQIKNAIDKTLDLHNKDNVIELNLNRGDKPGVKLSEFKQQLDSTEKDKKTDSDDHTSLTWQDYAYLQACKLGLQPKCIAGTKLSNEDIEDIGEQLKQQAKEPSSTVEFK